MDDNTEDRLTVRRMAAILLMLAGIAAGIVVGVNMIV